MKGWTCSQLFFSHLKSSGHQPASGLHTLGLSAPSLPDPTHSGQNGRLEGGSGNVLIMGNKAQDMAT